MSERAAIDGVDLVPPPDDSFIHPRCYTSTAFYEAEMRVVFPRSWVFVGDLSQLAAEGDYVTEQIGHEPVVVVRDRNGALRAFSNVCPHRASLLVDGAGNCGGRLVCPYHGWSFDLDGRLVGVPRRQGFVIEIDRGSLGLHEVPVDTWEQFVFVNLSGDAPPLLEYLHPVPEVFAGHDLSNLTRAHAVDDLVQANWKVLMDNAYCDYHLAFVHRTSLATLIEPRSLHEEVWEYTGRLHATWAPEVLSDVTVKDGLTGEAARGSTALSVFPNWFIAGFPNGGASVMWWTPLSVGTTRARVWNYSPDSESDVRSDEGQLRQIQREDYEICELVQRGLMSRLYRPGPQHHLELRVRGFQQKLMTMLRAGFSEAAL